MLLVAIILESGEVRLKTAGVKRAISRWRLAP